MSENRLTWDEPDDLPDGLTTSETTLELLSILDPLEGEGLVGRDGDVYVAVA